jgi:serine/threonine protein kinase
MSKLPTTNIAGTQPIPGYILRKRLGAGGYGEVWLADAPGGLQKAVKLIFGNIDESRAANELRSLERIRSAHHPFILSLERIEIVEGKVIIVTELAECSLQDRFEAYRRQGTPGIPRVELLDFLRDSADALDFLAQKHSLQHLDVKPGNLLIIADHIKVADFGLVKDLHDPGHSLVSGLTPTYSAPEVFDGRPDFRSDQYSLAIVFMEMLSGRLPFNGRSAGELARQHLTQAPNLDPLPPADRSIVQRALSKNPLDRFATCRQFIDQLLKVRSAVVPVLETSERTKTTGEKPSHSVRASDTRNWTTGRKQYFASTISSQQFANEWNMGRAMFIGVGGQGVLALQELRSDILHNVDHRLTSDDYGWLALDTSRTELEKVIVGEKLKQLPEESAVLLPIHSPQNYKKYNSELFTPLSKRWLYNIPKSLSTEGVRPIATLALIANYPVLVDLLELRIVNLIKLHLADTDCQAPLKVYVTGSLHGGTGSALLAEVGFIVRRIFARHGFSNYRLCAVVSAATTTNRNAAANLQAANAIATMSELTHFMRQSSDKPSLNYRSGLAMSNETPFDWVSLVDGGMLDDRKAVCQNPRRLARCISLDCQTLASGALASSRSTWRQNELGWLRSVRCESVKQHTASAPDALAKQCCLDVLKAFLSYLACSECDAAGIERSSSENLVNNSSSFLPLTQEAIEKLIQGILRDMRLIPGHVPEDEFNLTWIARLSAVAENRQIQLAKDVDQWQRWISHHTQVRIYTWRQVDRIQLEVIQGLLNYLDQQLPAVIEKLKTTSPFSNMKLKLLEAAQNYLNELIRICVHFMEVVREQAGRYRSQLESWQQSLLAGSDSGRSGLELGITGLAPQTQTLFNQVCRLLEDRIASKLIAILKSTPETLGLPSIAPDTSIVEPMFVDQTEVEFLETSQKLFVQSCRDMSLNPDDLECHMYHYSTVNFDELKDMVPVFADGGGEIVRMVVTSREQLSFLEDTLNRLGIANTTTLFPGSSSLGTHVICDAVNLNLSHIVSTLWRPTGATLSLAERLRTRVDIEWEDVSMLLNWKNSAIESEKTDSEAAAATNRQESEVFPVVAGLNANLTPNSARS